MNWYMKLIVFYSLIIGLAMCQNDKFSCKGNFSQYVKTYLIEHTIY